MTFAMFVAFLNVFVCAWVRLFSGVRFVRQCLKSMCKEKGNIFSNSSLFCMFFFIDYKLLCALVALSCKLYSHTLKKTLFCY